LTSALSQARRVADHDADDESAEHGMDSDGLRRARTEHREDRHEREDPAWRDIDALLEAREEPIDDIAAGEETADGEERREPDRQGERSNLDAAASQWP
jgi:hypothetical protein